MLSCLAKRRQREGWVRSGDDQHVYNTSTHGIVERSHLLWPAPRYGWRSSEELDGFPKVAGHCIQEGDGHVRRYIFSARHR